MYKRELLRWYYIGEMYKATPTETHGMALLYGCLSVLSAILPDPTDLDAPAIILSMAVGTFAGYIKGRFEVHRILFYISYRINAKINVW